MHDTVELQSGAFISFPGRVKRDLGDYRVVSGVAARERYPITVTYSPLLREYEVHDARYSLRRRGEVARKGPLKLSGKSLGSFERGKKPGSDSVTKHRDYISTGYGHSAITVRVIPRFVCVHRWELELLKSKNVGKFCACVQLQVVIG